MSKIISVSYEFNVEIVHKQMIKNTDLQAILVGVGLGFELPILVLSIHQRNTALTVLSTLLAALLAGTLVWVLVGESNVSHHVDHVPTQGDFMIPTTMDTIYTPLRRGIPWEPHVQKALEEEILPGDNVIDAGAHIGTFTIVMANQVGPTGVVFAFEPIPSTQQLLRNNVAMNKQNNVMILPYALADIDGGTVTMKVPSSNRGNASITANDSNGIQVQRRTLDSLMRDVDTKGTPMPTIKAMKIDVEGEEVNLLRGAKELLIRDKPVIVIEMWEKTKEAITNELSTQGYSVKSIGGADYIARSVK